MFDRGIQAYGKATCGHPALKRREPYLDVDQPGDDRRLGVIRPAGIAEEFRQDVLLPGDLEIL